MLIASGARFGFKRTLPHILGVALGVAVTAGLTGLGLGALMARYPSIAFGLKLLAAGWIFYLGYKLYRSLNAPEAEVKDKPFTLFQAVLFQWVNPKVWAIALAAAAGYSAGLPPINEGVRLAVAFGGLNLFVCLFYANAGQQVSKLFNTPKRWHRFMTVMAVLLTLSGFAVFL